MIAGQGICDESNNEIMLFRDNEIKVMRDMIIEKDLYINGTIVSMNTETTIKYELQEVPVNFSEFINLYNVEMNKMKEELIELRRMYYDLHP